MPNGSCLNEREFCNTFCMEFECMTRIELTKHKRERAQIPSKN